VNFTALLVVIGMFGSLASDTPASTSRCEMRRGESVGLAIASCIEAVQEGGIVDARGLSSGDLGNLFKQTQKQVTVLLGCGSFSAFETIEVPSGARLLGSGFCTEIRMMSDPPVSVLRITGDNAEIGYLRVSTSEVAKDVGLQGKGAIHIVSGAAQAWIHHNVIDRVRMVGITSEGEGAHLDHNVISESAEHGIYLSAEEAAVVHHNVVNGAGTGAFHAAAHGIKIVASPYTKIYSNFVVNSMQHGISIEVSRAGIDATGVTIEGNEIGRSGQSEIRVGPGVTGSGRILSNHINFMSHTAQNAGINLQRGAHRFLVEGNIIRISSLMENSAGIRCVSQGGAQIIGNIIIADALNVPFGILVDSGRDSMISDNTLRADAGSFSVGIRTRGSLHTVVECNVVDAETPLLPGDGAIPNPACIHELGGTPHSVQ